MNTDPIMTDAEAAFLQSKLKPADRLWMWAPSALAQWLSSKVRYATAVECDRGMAAAGILLARENVSVIYAPPDIPLAAHDGDHATFRQYVGCYSGKGIDVVLIAGMAREACARQVAQAAEYGPNPETRIFLLNAGRPVYERIWRDNGDTYGRAYLRPVEQVEGLMLLAMREDG